MSGRGSYNNAPALQAHAAATAPAVATAVAANASQPSSVKRDKRRQTIAARIIHISKMFEQERDMQYREMLHALQSTLSSLHSGKNAEFLEQLTDIEELRDQELMRLNLWESYQIEQTESEYQREISLANEEYNRTTQLVKSRLMARLESQRKRLREEKAYLDIANENNMFLTLNNGSAMAYNNNGNSGYTSAANGNANGSSLYAKDHVGYTSTGGGATTGYGSNGDATGARLSGYNSGGAGSTRGGGGNDTPNSPVPFGFPGERRSLRRREHVNASAFEEMSGFSAGGGGGNGSGGERTGYSSAGGTGSKRRKTGASTRNGGVSGDDLGASDRDALDGFLFSRDRDLAGSLSGGGGNGGATGGSRIGTDWAAGSGAGTGYGSGAGGAGGAGYSERGGGGGGSAASHGRSSKLYQAPATLKVEDALDDLAQLRQAVTVLKRKRAGL